MKKSLFFLAVAAVALASCSSDDTIAENSNVGKNQQKEIAFMPVNQNATRGTGAITGAFPTSSSIEVAAYDAQNNVNFFNAATFVYNTHNTSGWWGCSTAKYWPLSPATINFLGYANLTSGSTSWSTPNAAGVTLTMGDNSTEQNDLMYAVGQGKVTQAGNALIIPDKVDMVFTHAQALLTFNVKANVASTITLKKITLNNAIYSGSLAIVNNNYNQTSGQAVTSATWTPGSPTATLDIFSGSYEVSTSSEKKADIMVVPNPSGASFDSFTLTYRIAGVDKDYTYTFVPVDRNLVKATKYVYDISFNLHEIFINATVTPWIDTTPINYVDVPTQAFAYVASTSESGTYTLPSATAGTYTVSITGLPADTYTVSEGTTGTDFITDIKPSSSVTLGAGDPLNISFTVTASSGNSRTIEIYNDESTPVKLFTLTVTQP